MKKSSQGGQHRRARRTTEGRVGIFWLLDGKAVIESAPLSEAENDGEFKVHPGDHYSIWDRLQRDGIVPADMEYEEPPRGRVMFHTKTRRFTLLADRCILRDKDAVRQIMAKLKLPSKNTDKGSDNHYRCFRCLGGN